MRFTTRTELGVTFLQAEGLGTIHGFSTRLGGVSPAPFDTLNLGLSQGDDPARVRENYCRFCAAIGADVDRLVCSRQVHGDAIRVVTAADAGKGLDRQRDYEVDGLITNVPGLPLAIHTADCIPVLLYDPVHRAIGACHAGWRGTALAIPAKTVAKMTQVYGTEPKDLRCAIGAGISRCCFETRADVPEAMRETLGEAAEPFIDDHGDGRFHVDLKGINRHWLTEAGVPEDQIAVSDECTVCLSEKFFSHRRSGAARGAMAAVIQLP